LEPPFKPRQWCGDLVGLDGYKGAKIAPSSDRGAPLWDLPDARTGNYDPHAQPAPAYQFDQRITW
jgi:hypothetical protein